MLSFKQFLLEFTEGQIDRTPLRGSANIFTKAAGYSQSGRQEFNPKASALVRVHSFFPVDGRMKTAGEATGGKIPRETLHFTRNGVVSDHMYGNWAGEPFVTISPEHHLRDRVLYSGDHDVTVYGGADLPHGSRVLVHGGRLDDEQKKHITGLVGAKDWDEAHAKIRAFDPEKGIHGHTVRYGQREITISGLTDQEMQSKTGLTDATHRHLHALGIRPITIGQHYSTGYHRDDLHGPAGQEKTYTDLRLDRERDEKHFDKIYGSGGLIQTHYRSRRNTTPYRHGSLEGAFKFQGSGSPVEGSHGWEDAIMFHQGGDHPQKKEFRDLLHDIHENPTDYHPTAYSHPDARAALKRQISLLSR
jgi:hypothetical protein